MDTIDKRPEITVFAGPNGSGKSTITKLSPHGRINYINADEIAVAVHCDNMTAAQKAEALRNSYVNTATDFSFETVLSTARNLDLLRRAKEEGYFIRGIFVLTTAPELNAARVFTRVLSGGHAVPEDKIRSRYEKSLANIPDFVTLCDVCHIYDNTYSVPKRIFRKKRGDCLCWTNRAWSAQRICDLVQLPVTTEQGRTHRPKAGKTLD